LARGRVKLKIEDEKLERVRPEDLADHLEKTNVVNARKVLNTLEKEFAAEVISNLNINFQTAIFKDFSPERSAKVLTLIDPDEAIAILLTLYEQNREKIISLFDDKNQKEVRYLLNLSKTPIGDLITPEFIQVNSDTTVRQIIDHIKKTGSEFSQLNYVYMINSKKQLVGVCNLQELLMENLDTPAYRFMNQNVIVIHLTTPEELAIKKMLKYKLYALPVVSSDKSLLGIVTIDDIMEFILTKML
jgi:magnesium transporter